jgi:uncharacterized DUF497 family protein
MTQHFEWDSDKNKRNIDKHGISFYDAIQIFEGKYLSYISPRNDEDRMVGVGIVKDRIIAVTYTLRLDNIRIISARIARRIERKLFTHQYEENKNK